MVSWEYIEVENTKVENTYTLLEEGNIFFGERAEVWLKIGSKRVRVDLVARLGAAEVLVRRRSGDQIMQVAFGKYGHVVDLFLLLVGHDRRHLAHVVDGRIVELDRVLAKRLEAWHARRWTRLA
jgi:hypothetical protein